MKASEIQTKLLIKNEKTIFFYTQNNVFIYSCYIIVKYNLKNVNNINQY